jgi:hypothetical protein
VTTAPATTPSTDTNAVLSTTNTFSSTNITPRTP